MSDLLTEVEKAVMSDICAVWRGFCTIVGNGPTRDADLGEITPLIHQLQQAVMSQACARAYPTEYRLLGETLHATDEAERLGDEGSVA